VNFFQVPDSSIDAMFDPPDDDNLPDAPPVNDAMECYRMLLWLMPTCVAVTTMVGVAALPRWFPAFSGYERPLWLVVNFASTIALGIFRAKLAPPCEDGSAPRLDPVAVVIFVVIQIFLVPFLAYVIGIALMVTGVLD